MRATITMPIETLALIIAKVRAMERDAGEDEADVERDDEDDEDDDESAAEESEMLAADDDEAAIEDLEDEELAELLGGFSDDELAELLALMWIGSGRFGEDRWDEALDKARAVGGEDVLTHLVSADDLGDLIEGGLVELGYTIAIGESEMRS